MSAEATATTIPSAPAVPTALSRRPASPRLVVMAGVEAVAAATSVFGVVRAGEHYFVSLPLAALAAVWIALLGFTLQSLSDETRAR